MIKSTRYRPVEITFVKGEKEEVVTPERLFHDAYSSLENVANENFQRFIVDKNKKPIINPEFYEKKMQDFEDNPSTAYAIIKFNNGEEVQYNIERRTNFALNEMLKLPNILLLSSGKDTMILREARAYDFDYMVTRMRKLFENDIDVGNMKILYGEDGDDVLTPKKKGVLSIPENLSTLAFENMYEDEVLQRITPKPYIIGSESKDKLWYIRDFSPLAIDLNFTPKNFGKYLGRLNAVGLMEGLDRQLVHYYLKGDKSIANYDPDFLLHSNNRMRVDQLESESVKEVIAAELKQRDPREFWKLTKEYRNRMIGDLGKQGINSRTIFNYLPTKNDISKMKNLVQLNTKLY